MNHLPSDSHTHPRDDFACDEYRRVSRRRFLELGSMSAASVTLPSWLPQVQFAESEDGTRDVLVSVYLRGGADGLSLVAPYADPSYYALRPTIAIPRPDANSPNRGLALDNFFMLPPAMAPLMAPYLSGELLAVHACGQAATTSRSHFEAERYLEQGKPDDYTIQSGWLARHLATSAPLRESAPLRAAAITYGMPRTLVGAPKSLPVPRPASFGVSSPHIAAVQRMYNGAWTPMRDSAIDGLATIAILSRLDFNGYRPANGATYRNDALGQAMRSIATMIKGDIGLEAAHVDGNGWDTHANQGTIGGGLADTMTEFASALRAFWQDIMQGPTTARVTLIATTEFGRNARENGSFGTDHGRASVMFVMGKAIAGGQVIRQWPGLAREQLEDGQDLRVTIDTRDVLAEVVQNRLNNRNLAAIFPDYTPRFRGVTK
jgi:uncharacterized protein (DUF1501 family)